MSLPNIVVPIVVAVVLWLAAMALLYRWWHQKAAIQQELFGEFPQLPANRGEEIVPELVGIYAGTVLTSDRITRVLAGGLGLRNSVIARAYQEGITIESSPTHQWWIPAQDISAIGIAAGIAGKNVPGRGVLVIDWSVNNQAISTGLRADNRQIYQQWLKLYRSQQEKGT